MTLDFLGTRADIFLEQKQRFSKKQQSMGRHVVPLGKVYGMTRPWIKPTIYPHWSQAR
jgi:hypothetical protein